MQIVSHSSSVFEVLAEQNAFLRKLKIYLFSPEGEMRKEFSIFSNMGVIVSGTSEICTMLRNNTGVLHA